MQITPRVDRTVRVVVELASIEPGATLTPGDLARLQQLSVGDVLDVLGDLKRHRIVDGGPETADAYRLARPADSIAVAELVRVASGPLVDVAGSPPEDVEYPGAAEPLRDVWLSTRTAVRSVLEHVTVADVVADRLPAVVTEGLAPEAARRRPLPEGSFVVTAAEGGGEVAHIAGVELPPEDVVVAAVAKPRPLVARLAFLVLGLGAFVTALGLMKAGAAELIPTLEGSLFTDNAWSTLGLGWLGACIVMSGSPVAASSLSLLEGGAIDRTQSFTMLTGSRLGAAFVVLVVGVVYAARRSGGAGRRAPLSIGILSLLMTAIVYLPGALIGFLLLDSGALDNMDIGTSPSLTSATDSAFGWAVDLCRDLLPDWTLFPVGLGVLLVGFQLFDRVLPAVGGDSFEHRPDGWYTRKWPMFALGCGVCLLTLSVSVALTVLVPLVAKGYLRRANTLPYIAGANITTLADTLVVAVLLGNQDGVRVVVAVTLAVSVWTLALLAFAYPWVRRGCLGVARRVLLSRERAAAFVIVLLSVPSILIAV